jgi:hypothetical protein
VGSRDVTAYLGGLELAAELLAHSVNPATQRKREKAILQYYGWLHVSLAIVCRASGGRLAKPLYSSSKQPPKPLRIDYPGSNLVQPILGTSGLVRDSRRSGEPFPLTRPRKPYATYSAQVVSLREVPYIASISLRKLFGACPGMSHNISVGKRRRTVIVLYISPQSMIDNHHKAAPDLYLGESQTRSADLGVCACIVSKIGTVSWGIPFPVGRNDWESMPF